MGGWANLNFQEEATVLFCHLVSFHDFTLLVLRIILAFVRLVIFNIIQKTNFISKTLRAHHALEFIWTLLPVLVLVIVAIPSLTLLFIIEDSSRAFLTRKVVGFQWYWAYHIPVIWDGTFTAQEDIFSYICSASEKDSIFRLLDTTQYMPIFLDIPLRILISSADVLHSWTVPAIGVKADACPGRLNEVIVTPARTGTFFGQCSEICGRNHRFMPIEVKVLSWV